ncbi:MAG: dihydrofolate reductase family protein [Anaerolineaceae bacterium]|nr:dihydrofolate reductase family protein [Anaerolineaceae bacterium]
MDDLIRLYPTPSSTVPLRGAYLSHNLRQFSEKTHSPFVYANFVGSVDGRIAISNPTGAGFIIPKTIANQRDWRLFQELVAQADIILSSGRYLRDWAEGRAQEILQVNDPRIADLQIWREKLGLKLQPDIAIISASLDFPIPLILTKGERKVVIVTTSSAKLERIKDFEKLSLPVVIAGNQSVEGDLLKKGLSELGYQTIYSAAGPKILHLLSNGLALDRLYLTHVNRLLGGQPFSSILEGPLLDPPLNLKIDQIYLDPSCLDGLGQFFISYDRV